MQILPHLCRRILSWPEASVNLVVKQADAWLWVGRRNNLAGRRAAEVAGVFAGRVVLEKGPPPHR